MIKMGETQVKKPEENIKKFDMNLAPDGGYGYIICVAMCINCVCLFGHASSFGVQYNEFFKQTGSGTGTITTVYAVSSTIMSFGGILVNVTLKKYSTRQVALVGALIYTLGWLSNYFITSIQHMFITNGVLQGAGTAILIAVSFTSFNQYFVKKRMMVMSVCQTLICILQMLYPLFLERLLINYGFRGSLLINTGLIAHTIFAAICFQPVSWHYRKKSDYENYQHDKGVQLELLEKKKPVANAISKIMEIKDLENNLDEKKTTFWSTISEQMDLSLLSDIIYMNITIGISISCAAEYAFGLMYPLYLYSMDYTTSQVAFLLTITAGADLVSRIFMAIVGHFRHFPSRSIFFIAVSLGVLSKILFLQFNSFGLLALSSFLIGFFRGPPQVTVPLVFAEYLPEKFSAAYGLAMFFMGSANTLLFPSTGYIRDLSDSYVATFYFVNLVIAICMMPWFYEFWYFRKDRSIKIKKRKNSSRNK